MSAAAATRDRIESTRELGDHDQWVIYRQIRASPSNFDYVPVDEFQRLLAAGDRRPPSAARAFAALARINTLYMIAGAWSGHIGTSFSSLEIMSWLFLNELRDLDQRTRRVRRLLLVQGPRRAGALRRADRARAAAGREAAPAAPAARPARPSARRDAVHPGQHRLARHGHLEGQGDGAGQPRWPARARRDLRADRRRRTAGRAVLGVARRRRRPARLGEIVAIIDHNKIQSDTWVERVSRLGDLEAKFDAFGWHVSRVDGHDVRRPRARRSARSTPITDRPKVIIADTVKGKGVSFMEGPAALAADELYLFHSGAPPRTAVYRRAGRADGDAPTRCSPALGLGAGAHGDTGAQPAPRAAADRQPGGRLRDARWSGRASGTRDLLALDADLIKDCGLLSFAKQFPDRFVECGIAEQDMVSMAAGMARRGALPVVHSFACFLSARPNEQIYNQCSESLEGDLRRLARRPAARRARPLAPVGPRHLGARRGAAPGAGGAVAARPRSTRSSTRWSTR